MMKWLRDTPCNVTEIKSNEMMKLLLVEWSCNHWFFSKKIFYIRKIRKSDVFRNLTTITRITKLTEGKVGSVKKAWRIVKVYKVIEKFGKVCS